MQTDEALAARVAEGDEPALRELLRRYERPLGALPPSPDRRARRRGSLPGDLAARRPPRRALRRRAGASRPGSSRSPSISAATGSAARRRSRAPAVDEPAARRARARPMPALDAAQLLARLPAAQREVVVLRYFQDLSEDDVATILDIPKGTVKSRLHQAIARLAALVRGEERGPHREPSRGTMRCASTSRECAECRGRGAAVAVAARSTRAPPALPGGCRGWRWRASRPSCAARARAASGARAGARAGRGVGAAAADRRRRRRGARLALRRRVGAGCRPASPPTSWSATRPPCWS